VKKFWRFILLAIILFPALVQAQDEDTRIINNQLWADYYEYWDIKPNWQFYGDAGARTVLEKWSWFMVFGRPSIRWKKYKLWEVHGGIGMFYTINVDEVNTFEIRPWQGFRVNWPTFRPIKFNHYFRLEERFNFLTDHWDLEFNLRVRYRFGLKALIYTFTNENNIFLPAWIEIFGNIGQQITEKFSNRTRFAIGAGYKMNKQWTFELHFVSQFSRTGGNDEFKTSDRLLQIKVRRFLYRRDYKNKLPHDDFLE